MTRDTGEKVTRWIISQHFYTTAGVRHKKMFATKTALPSITHLPIQSLLVLDRGKVDLVKYLLPQVTKQRVLVRC